MCFCKLYANLQQEDTKTLRETDVGYVWVEVNVWKREVFPSADRNTVGGPGTGGLMTSRLSFLFAHGNMPEEQERKIVGEEKKWRRHSWKERANAHLPDRERESRPTPSYQTHKSHTHRL